MIDSGVVNRIRRQERPGRSLIFPLRRGGADLYDCNRDAHVAVAPTGLTTTSGDGEVTLWWTLQGAHRRNDVEAENTVSLIMQMRF